MMAACGVETHYNPYSRRLEATRAGELLASARVDQPLERAVAFWAQFWRDVFEGRV